MPSALPALFFPCSHFCQSFPLQAAGEPQFPVQESPCSPSVWGRAWCGCEQNWCLVRETGGKRAHAVPAHRDVPTSAKFPLQKHEPGRCNMSHRCVLGC